MAELWIDLLTESHDQVISSCENLCRSGLHCTCMVTSLSSTPGASSAARTNPRQYSKKRKSAELMPKRPVPPFVLFSQEHRKILKEAQPSLQLKDTSQLLSQMWNSMSDEEKQVHLCQYMYTSSSASPLLLLHLLLPLLVPLLL